MALSSLYSNLIKKTTFNNSLEVGSRVFKLLFVVDEDVETLWEAWSECNEEVKIDKSLDFFLVEFNSNVAGNKIQLSLENVQIGTVIFENCMNIVIASDFEIVGCFNQFDMIFKCNFVDVSSLNKVIQRALVKLLNVINFCQEFIEIISSQDVTQKDWTKLLKIQWEFVDLFE